MVNETTYEEVKETTLPDFQLTMEGLAEIKPLISNFDELKEWVDLALQHVDTSLTQDTKSLKEVRARLNKLYDQLEDQRKICKKACMKPYEEWEKRYKDATASITDALGKLKTTIDTIEREERNKRLAEVERIIEKVCDELSPYLYQFVVKVEVRSWFFKKSWENKSTSNKMLEDQIRTSLTAIKENLDVIGGFAEPAVAREVYARTGSIAEAQKSSKGAEELKGKIAAEEAKLEEIPEKETVAEPAGITLHADSATEREVVVIDGSKYCGESNETYSLNLEVPCYPSEENRQAITINRSIKGEKYKIRLLLDVANALGLDLIKITRNDSDK